MKCEFCSNALTNKNRRFCSLSCSNRARPSRKSIFVKKCIGCDQDFTVDSKSRKNKFCSRSCSAKINNLGMVRNGTAQTKTCMACLKPVSNRNRSGYCTNECRWNDEIKRWLSGELDGCWKYTHASYVRRYLEQKTSNSCEECGYNTTRKDGSSILQVDHIDGNWRNNKPENVRLLCPNCHCLTDTWGAGNMGRGRTWKKEYSQYYKK